LLYNYINGEKEVHFGKSIHIRYLSLPKDAIEAMEGNREVSGEKADRAKKIAMA
jgi:hypothetical protein